MIRYNLNTEIQPFSPALDFHDAVVLTGSCFSDHIASRMKESYFSVFSQPCGVVFNPVSMAEPFKRALQSFDFNEHDLLHHNGLWHSKHHHGSFSEPGKPDVLRKANHMLHELKRALHASRYLFITWGTAWVYDLADGGGIVANCHKIPQDRFNKRLLGVHDIVEAWHGVMEWIKTFNHNLEVVFTVSPVKHLRDGVVENNLSKSLLFSALHELRQTHAHMKYFPAFELVNDDLRDYRFYEKDGAHPNALAIDYVYDKFKTAVYSPETQTYATDIEQYLRMSRHRLLREDGEEYVQFMKKLEDTRTLLNSRYDIEL